MCLALAGACRAAESTSPEKTAKPSEKAASDNKKEESPDKSELSEAKTKAAIHSSHKLADDVLSKALTDELLRTVSELKISNRQKPYFVAYTILDHEGFSVFGSFGALDQVSDHRYRTLKADVRVGDYKLDSSGRQGFFSFMDNRRGSASIDDDYDALRHELWLNTDYQYKRAIEGLENKKAILQQKKIEDLPDSMSKAEPAVSMQPEVRLNVNRDEWQKTVRDISALFRSYPQVIDSTVMFSGESRTRWFANSEGSLNRESLHGVMFGISANGQAPDGMRVSDFEVFSATDEKKLPSPAELAQRAKVLAERIRDLASAKTMEDYRGPILFEKQAAAELFAQALAPRLVNKIESLSGYSRFNRANEKPGRKILPTYISVIDDPLATEFNGQPLKGGYLVDDEGVQARKVTLVENGILKTYCSSRSPGRDVKESNGHLIDGVISPSQLFIVSSRSEPLDKLKEKLIALGKEEGLDYVLLVRRISSTLSSLVTPGRSSFFYSSEDVQMHPPTLLYKVYVNDGHEELVRGAKFSRLTHRLFRDITALADDAAPYPVYYQFAFGSSSKTLVTPSVLISEIDIERESHETDTPMILKNAYFDEQKTNTGQTPKDGTSGIR